MSASTSKALEIGDVNLYDPDKIEREGIPLAELELLRRTRPIHFHPEPNGPGFWVITKYRDIETISTDNVLFSSARGGTNIEDYTEEDLSAMRAMLHNMDPPQHSKYRRNLARSFTPRMISQLEERIRDRADRLIDRIAAQGQCDFVADLAVELPLQAIAELVGIPMEDRQKVFDWSNRLIGFEDPEYHVTENDARMAAMEIFGYGSSLSSRRREHPTEDLLSKLVHQSEVDGEQLTEMEVDGFFLLLCIAGNETTRNLLSGAMLTLTEHPDQYQMLRDDRGLLNTAVEELLRWLTPVIYFRRTVSRDTELGGVAMKEGDKVAMYYPSANRDEDVFENGHLFDITRDPNPHLTFGIGEHFCMGANLARLEIRVMLEQLLDRLPDMKVSGPVRRLRSTFIHGFKAMPVSFTPERGSSVVDVGRSAGAPA